MKRTRARRRSVAPGRIVQSGSILVVLVLGLFLPAHRVRAGTLFALVDTGELHASTDGGASWQVRATLPVRDAVALAAGRTSTELYLMTRSGTVHSSTDAGQNWNAVGACAAHDVVAGTLRANGDLLLLTATGTVWWSVDQGASFTVLTSLVGANHVSLTRDREGILYALTATGEVTRSADGGTSWEPLGAFNVSDAVEIVSLASTLFVLTGTGEIEKSTDGGASWVGVGTLSQVHMSGLSTDPASGRLVASTREGEVAISSDGIAWTWVGTINQLVVEALANDQPLSGSGVPEGTSPAARFRVGLPWPNPVAGNVPVLFPFFLPSSDTVGLEVYDVRGRLVVRRAPSLFLAGEGAVSLSAVGMPSGIYFARLTTGTGYVAKARWSVAR